MSYFQKYVPQIVGFFGLVFLFIDSAIYSRWNNYTHELLLLASIFFGGAGMLIVKRRNIWMGSYHFSGIVAIFYGSAFLVMGAVCIIMLINYLFS